MTISLSFNCLKFYIIENRYFLINTNASFLKLCTKKVYIDSSNFDELHGNVKLYYLL